MHVCYQVKVILNSDESLQAIFDAMKDGKHKTITCTRKSVWEKIVKNQMALYIYKTTFKLHFLGH